MPAFKEGDHYGVPSPPPCLEGASTGVEDIPPAHSYHPYPYYHPMGVYLNQYRAHQQNKTLQSFNRDADSMDTCSFLGRRGKAPKHLRICALGKTG